MIGIIGALESEINLLAASLQDIVEREIAHIPFLSGHIGQEAVVLAQCGVGKVNAAICAQIMVDLFNVRALINTGVAGGLAPELSIGDFVIGESAVQHDFNACALGYARGYMCTGEDSNVATMFHSSPDLIRAFEIAAEGILEPTQIHRGRIATGDLFVAERNHKRKLQDEFMATAAEMEGAAIAQVAVANDIPFIIVRAISDLADHEAVVSFDRFEKRAAQQSSRIVLQLLHNGFERA